MIHAGEKLPNVAFQNPACLGIIAAGFSRHAFETVQGFMHAIPLLTGE